MILGEKADASRRTHRETRTGKRNMRGGSAIARQSGRDERRREVAGGGKRRREKRAVAQRTQPARKKPACNSGLRGVGAYHQNDHDAHR